jgi:hypothetical protein
VSTAQRTWTTGFYWTGITLSGACLVLILAGNTELAWRFEHASFPLSWAFAGVAVLAFVAFEFCDRTFSPPREGEDPSSQPSAEWEGADWI